MDSLLFIPSFCMLLFALPLFTYSRTLYISPLCHPRSSLCCLIRHFCQFLRRCPRLYWGLVVVGIHCLSRSNVVDPMQKRMMLDRKLLKCDNVVRDKQCCLRLNAARPTTNAVLHQTLAPKVRRDCVAELKTFDPSSRKRAIIKAAI